MENRYSHFESHETPIIKDGVDFIFRENPELEQIGSKEEYSKYIETIYPDSSIKDIVYHGTDFSENIKEEGFDVSKMKRSNIGIGTNFSLKRLKASEFGDETIEAVVNAKDFLQFKNTTVDGIILSEKQLESFNKYLYKNREGYSETVEGLKKYMEERAQVYGFITGLLRDTNEDIPAAINLLNSMNIRGSIGQLHGYDVITVNNNEDIHILGSKKDIEMFKDFLTEGNI